MVAWGSLIVISIYDIAIGSNCPWFSAEWSCICACQETGYALKLGAILLLRVWIQYEWFWLSCLLLGTGIRLNLHIYAHLSCFQGSVSSLTCSIIIVPSSSYFSSWLLFVLGGAGCGAWKKEGIGTSSEILFLLVSQPFIENMFYPESNCFVAGRLQIIHYWKQYSVNCVFLTYLILSLLLQRVFAN